MPYVQAICTLMIAFQLLQDITNTLHLIFSSSKFYSVLSERISFWLFTFKDPFETILKMQPLMRAMIKSPSCLRLAYGKVKQFPSAYLF